MISNKFNNIKNDLLSGLTVAIALVPEAIAFSFIANVDPIIGLWSAVFMGFITASFGGRPGMISGATGAIAVIAGKAVEYGNKIETGLGMEFLFAVIMLAGIIQIIFGTLKLGRFIRLVPHSVMIGFVNGLAIVIGLGQIDFFKSQGEFLIGNSLYVMLGLIILTMGIIYFFPKLTKAVPSTLVAIVVVALISHSVIDSRTIADILKEQSGSNILKGSFPIPSIPVNIDWADHWVFILKISFFIAMVGIIESLMTLQIIDEITETRGKGNKECLAQGGANIVSGIFGGMGGCAMIGQSIINIKSGGRGRLSGIIASLALMFFIMLGGPIITQIPIAALVGVMFMVVIGTFEWSTFKAVGKVDISEIIIILSVTLITVFLHNLALAVFIGIILSALVFAWKSSKHVIVSIDKDTKDERVYSVKGVLYFASIVDFKEKFQAKSDAKNIIIDLKEARVFDLSALEAINSLGMRYKDAGKTLNVRHLSRECQKMLLKAGTLIDIKVLEDDPSYLVANIKDDK